MRLALALAICLAAGCSQPAPSLTVDDLGDGVLQLHPDPASLKDIPDGTPGKSLDQDLRDCVYVQWCNEPGRRGTICRARAECGCSGVIECNEEVNRICGGFTDPAYFLCPGQP